MPERRSILLGLAGVAAFGALAARAEPATDRRALFTADLRGDQPPADTNSKATGHARVAIDLDAQAVDLDLAVTGITLDQLWDKLKDRPIGPIHFHHYGSMHHVADAATSLVFPVPFGHMYADAINGFTVTMRDFSYAKGAALLNSTMAFDDFLASLRAGVIALNVHTNAFPDGEINGAVLAAS
jgi:CHRD domain